MPRSSTRAASHAGSWYTDDGNKLDQQLSTWLAATADPKTGDALTEAPVKGCKAIIGPHAGYSYSGPAAAFAYKCIDVENVKRVFVLGPSHHVYLDGCALSKCKSYQTPVGELPLDRDTIAELKATGKFEEMDLETDEDEHSYIRKVFEGRNIKVVPILVGAISTASERSFGALLAPYLADPSTFFVVSSDFCHWGTRFRYTSYQPPSLSDVKQCCALSRDNFAQAVPDKEVWRGIEQLDRLGMDTIAFSHSATGGKSASAASKSPSEAHEQFAAYLKATKNTICGRHPIGVLLGALAALEQDAEWSRRGVRCEWVRYEQSSQVRSLSDSSVSYASAFVAVGAE
ncbi:hypothetical protein Rhopal_006604-T1 [Rhodotorula paludigena]|uniref:Uncharacterized protein n=1 Tax=Rhodotorula paludigena TaxID=86838 RepID=A0AAV5GWZ0_9BASI|nr:hypothetical protein Rhopal_006604-T1 [Rhodotorula paludigena]